MNYYGLKSLKVAFFKKKLDFFKNSFMQYKTFSKKVSIEHKKIPPLTN